MSESIKDLAAYSFFVVTAGWVAFNFLAIIFRGQTVIGFEGYALNIMELVFALAIFGLAVERWISHVILRRGSAAS